MSDAVQKFVALNKRQAETAIRAVEIGFAAWEMLVKLNLEATKSLLQENAANIHAFSASAEIADLSVWSGQVRAAVDKISGYSRNVYEIAGQAGSDLADVLEQTLLSSDQEVFEWVDEVWKSSSMPRPQATAAAAKAAMTNAKAVIEGISKAVRQTAGYADASVRAAAAATAEAVKNSAK